MEPDFSGWATKNNRRCSDGRTILPGAFKHLDGATVPLVWQHNRSSPENVLGHAKLENQESGVYAYCFLNDTGPAKHTGTMIEHGDVNALSIYADNLTQQGQNVVHGDIREVSVVLAGANPEALIDNVYVQHGEDVAPVETEAVIYTGLTLEHKIGETGTMPTKTDEATDEKTVQDIFDELTEEQKNVVYYLIAEAVNGDSEESGDGEAKHGEEFDVDAVVGDISEKIIQHMKEEPGIMTNVFEQAGHSTPDSRPTLTHAQLQTIITDAQKNGSFKEAFLAHAGTFGIDDIEYLFPDAKTITSQPDLVARRTEWVKAVIDGAKHSPFSRIKSLAADLTAAEARAKGYVRGNLKKDEVIKLLKRVTTPTTVYKKQKLDRDDIVDITDLDVVAWLKWEMRFMLEEELARAILIGDGREPDDDDKIDEEKVRPIAWDVDMYNHTVTVPSNTTPEGYVESILRARKHYKGTGTPALYTTDDILTDMLLIKDKVGRRVYANETELAATLRVSKIVVVEVMEDEADLIAIIVNLADYTIGADKGGQVAMFDDFDIDYNQQKYLMETRVSGSLTKPKSAVTIQRSSGTIVTSVEPTFVPATNTITVPTVAGVSYFNVTDPFNEVELTDGADVVITETTDVEARADTGYAFAHNTDNDWTFAYTAP